MSAADPQNHDEYDCRKYFSGATAWVNSNDLIHTRFFRMHVVRCNADGSLPMTLDLAEGAWWLDVDEDFLSCSNPDRSLLDAFLSSDDAATVRLLYGHWESRADLMHMQRILQKELFHKTECEFMSHPDTQHVCNLAGDTAPVLQLYKMCRRLYSPERTTIRALFSPKVLHGAGVGCWLPHHISTAEEVAQLLAVIKTALTNLPTDPLLITVARSCTDGFVPIFQTQAIHNTILKMFQQHYKKKLSVHTVPVCC